MATKPANAPGEGSWEGGTFLAWRCGDHTVEPWYTWGSYGVNIWVNAPRTDPDNPYCIRSTADVKNPAAVPVILDSRALGRAGI